MARKKYQFIEMDYCPEAYMTRIEALVDALNFSGSSYFPQELMLAIIGIECVEEVEDDGSK